MTDTQPSPAALEKAREILAKAHVDDFASGWPLLERNVALALDAAVKATIEACAVKVDYLAYDDDGIATCGFDGAAIRALTTGDILK